MTQGMPSSNWPVAAATTQPIDRAPCPTWPHEVSARLEFGPFCLSSSIAASDSLRMRAVSTVSAVSITSLRILAVSSGWLGAARLRMASKCKSRTALLASVNFAALPVVRLSTLSLSVGERQKADNAADRLIRAGRQITAPQHVDQLGG